MKVREARALASRWVGRHTGAIPGFAGAFLSGSVAWLPAGDELPASSDVDVMVVTAQHPPPPKLGKLPYGGVLVEVSFLSLEQLGSSERVLGSYYLAGSFRTDTVLADPTGRLAELRAVVAGEWAALAPTVEPGFRALLADLGISSPSDLPHRAHQLRAFMPRLARVRDAILAANPAIRA
jgi:hypothetical protein